MLNKIRAGRQRRRKLADWREKNAAMATEWYSPAATALRAAERDRATARGLTLPELRRIERSAASQ